MRWHSAAWRRNSSDGFTVHLIEIGRALKDQVPGSLAVPEFMEKEFMEEDLARRTTRGLTHLGTSGIYQTRDFGGIT